jgi:hypothetical protein
MMVTKLITMKTQSIKYLYIFGVLLAALSIGSCEDPADGTVANQAENITLSELDITEIELDQSNPGNPAVTFIWSEADYDVQTAENYILEFSNTESFENAIVLASLEGNTNISLTTVELNSAAGELGFPPFAWNSIYARITSTLGDFDALPQTSNVISFRVYPYFNYPFTDLYFVGPACASGWNNNNNNPVLFRSADNPDQFSYTGLFNADQLKILENKGAWAPQYGEGEQGVLQYRATEDDPDPLPIDDFTSSGYFTFTANVRTNEFSITPADGSSNSLSSLSISGSAIDAPLELVQYSVGGSVFDTHIWQVSEPVSLNPGTITFTANGSQNWGGDTAFSGVASQGGNPIEIIVGDEYEVWFNDLTGEYMFIPLNF